MRAARSDPAEDRRSDGPHPEGQDRADHPATPALVADSILHRAFALACEGQIPAAADALRGALRASDAPPDPLDKAALDLLDSVHQMQAGHYAAALRHAMPALRRLEPSEHAPRLAWAYSAIGFSLGRLGDPERGLEWVGRAIALAEAGGQPINAMKARSDQGCLLGMTDAHDLAVDALERALDIAEGLALPFAQAGCLNNLAATWLARARRAQALHDGALLAVAAGHALDRATRAQAIAAEANDGKAGAWAGCHRALALVLLGRTGEADTALAGAARQADPYAQVRIEVLQARAALGRLRGDLDDARRWLDLALAAVGGEGYELTEAQLLDDRVALETAAGRHEEAIEWMQRRHRHLEAHYRRRLRMVARSAEVFAEVEQSRLDAKAALERERSLSAANDALRSQAPPRRSAALHDGLTQMLNRRGLELQGRSAFTLAPTLVVAVLDIDCFEDLYDRHGHLVGDAVLGRLSRLIGSKLRHRDLVARTGSGEFVLLLHDMGARAALSTCERLRHSVERYAWNGIAADLRVTVSIGLAKRDHHDTLDTLLADAEAALFAAKAAGCNRVQRLESSAPRSAA